MCMMHIIEEKQRKAALIYCDSTAFIVLFFIKQVFMILNRIITKQ